ncbi:MAG: 23S rRNA (guanosine(2251)-2'-O)-methyltransferase RlmB [Clostridia bacterium]|nr:23S rRNA (guanosine(2251)-2'-O)-methyltransferase RlmB [Clostridia bacterium]
MPEKQEPAENILAGRNPIREAINAGRPIEKLLVARGLTGSAVEIIARARQAGIVVQEVDRKRLDAVYPNHQGMVAYASAGEYAELADLLEIPEERGEEPFFVALDGVTDPHNLGAILRSAAAAGAHGVIVPERRAAGLVPAAVKASAGALEHIAVVKVGNLRQALDTLKERGIWLVAAASDGENVYGTDLTGSICLVIGSEGDGIGPLVRSTCDRVVSLPMENGMESLNASVAAGILLYEIRRARGAM